MVAAEQNDSALMFEIEDNESQTSSKTMTAPKEQTNKGDAGNLVTNTVSSVVTNIVDEASAASALESEKTRVQKLINGLVARAREDAISAGEADTKTGSNSSSLSQDDVRSKDSNPKGVPAHDYRPRIIENLPLDWSQAKTCVTVHVRVPSWVTKRHVKASFQTNQFKLEVSSQDGSGEPFICLDKTLFGNIDEDGSIWALDAHAATLLIELEKFDDSWWFTLFKDDDPATYKIMDHFAKSGSKSEEHTGSNGTTSMNGHGKAENGYNVEQSHKDKDESEMMDVIDVTSGTGKMVGRESAKGDGSEMTVENAVVGVVENVIADASKTNDSTHAQASISEAVEEKEPTTVVEDDSDDEIRPGRASDSSSSGTAAPGRRVLTRADLPKLIEESKATIEKGGPHAAEAAVQLATFYHYGIGVKQDDAEAVRLFKRGLEGGVKDGSAAFQLGLIYNTGAPGVTPDAEEAVRWWQVAASLQNPVAMFNLGVMAMNGSGCDMDPVTAMSWFQRAKALDPKLEVPQVSRAQLDQRVALAGRLRRQKKRREVAPEEWEKRKEEALQTVRTLGYTTAGLIGLGLSMVALRYWWRNRL